MDKKVYIYAETPETFEIYWMGFSIDVYVWVNNSTSAQWLSKRDGNHLLIQKESLVEVCTLLKINGYKLDDEIEKKLTNTNIESPKNDFQFRKYQIDDADLMFKRKKILNASEMGTGKTCVAIAAAKKTHKKTLIVCPASVCYGWLTEILKIYPSDSVDIFNKRKVSSNTKWLIISYEQFRINSQILGYKYECIILDEAHYIKSVDIYGYPSSQRAEVCIKACEQTEYVFLLTGTPIPSYTRDIYNLMKAIDANDVTNYNNYLWFANRYCDPQQNIINHNRFITHDGSTNREELHQKMKNYMIRRKRKEVLPDLNKNRQVIPVVVNKTKIMTPSIKHFFSEITIARKEIAKAKTGFTIDFANNLIEQNKKVVIVSCFLEPINIIQSAIEGSVILTGAMTKKERITSIEMFQNGDASAIILSLSAGGVGITLTRSANIIFNDFNFVPADIMQAEDRICRIGQKEKYCNVYYVTADNCEIDELASKVLLKKLNNINQILENEDFKDEIFREICRRYNG